MKIAPHKLWYLPILVGSLISVAAAAQSKSIDTERSSITIRVYKTGLLSSFGHEHEVRASLQRGGIDEAQRTIEFVVDSRTLRVMDRDVADKDRAEIQSTMLGPKVLDSEKFPEIRFRSTKVEQSSAGKWTVYGDLTLHGQTHPVMANVEEESGHYRGSATLKQKDFGITPVSVAGGSIKVKDEVRIEFEIFTRPEVPARGASGTRTRYRVEVLIGWPKRSVLQSRSVT
jgi:polyisoprenoid-binding protein YceI